MEIEQFYHLQYLREKRKNNPSKTQIIKTWKLSFQMAQTYLSQFFGSIYHQYTDEQHIISSGNTEKKNIETILFSHGWFKATIQSIPPSFSIHSIFQSTDTILHLLSPSLSQLILPFYGHETQLHDTIQYLHQISPLLCSFLSSEQKSFSSNITTNQSNHNWNIYLGRIQPLPFSYEIQCKRTDTIPFTADFIFAFPSNHPLKEKNKINSYIIQCLPVSG